MPTVADVMRRYGPAYLEQFGAAMPAEHKKVLKTIMVCRTRTLGTVLYICASCGEVHSMGRSCGNRHCPTCQQDKTKAWLENQVGRLLPCPYFLLTFTVPAALRDLMRRHQRVAYAALFEASSEAMTTLAADPKFVGSKRCGFFGVLHTWGRTLEYHPHLHYIVPGGAIAADGGKWLPSRANFFLPVEALSILFRAKFRDALARDGLLDQVDSSVWRQRWVVHSRAAGDGQASLKYLAPYVYRVAISDRRIVSFDDGQVTFSYRRSGSNRWRKMTLEAPEFIRRFLQHVLPSGFQKVRHHGFLSPNSRFSLDWVRWLISLCFGLIHLLWGKLPPKLAKAPQIRCPECGGPMHVLGYVPPDSLDYFDTS
jgi:hypothetical protein